MMFLGYILLFLAVVALIVGIMQRKKMKTIVSAPFKPTGQVQGGAGPDGLVSCQGAISVTEPLMAPVSGKHCLYYEIEIKQEWEQHVQTEDGMKKKTGKDSAHTKKGGSMFNVDDGSGPVQVDARESVDAKLEKSHTEKKSYGYGDISFGGYQVHINRPSDSDKHAIATHCVEKILPVDGNVFVVGKLTGDTITKRDGMMGKLMLAREGRDALVGSTKRNMMIGFIAAGLFFPIGGAMAAFGEAPEAAPNTCLNMTDGLDAPCIGRSYNADDVVFNWTVTTEGDYAFSSVGTGRSTSMRIWPHITVRDASGPVYDLSASGGAPVEGQHHFVPGSYEIHVNDTHYGWAENLEGGAGFSLMITQVGGGAAAAGAEAAPSGDSNFGTVSVSPGFTPDPTTASGTSGGSTDATTVNADCNGWIADTPDHLLVTGGDFASLRVMAHATTDGEDVTLVVQKPDGSYLCNDDTEGLDPVVSGAFPAGTYKIWIGSYEQGANEAYLLGVSELESVTPSTLTD